MSFVRRCCYIPILVLLVVAITSIGTLAAFAAVDPSMGLELAVADGLVESEAPAPAEVAPQVPHSLLAMILTAATPLLLAGLAWLGKRVDAWIAARTENELLDMVGGRVEAALHDVKLERARAPHLNGKDLKAFATAAVGGATGG